MSTSPTPLFSFPQDSPFSNVVLKREDASVLGSHKFRYYEKKLAQLKADGVEQVVLSTTGNAGITASHYGKKLGIRVFCLMHNQGSMNKAAQVEKEGGLLILSERPIRFAKYLAKRYEMPLLHISQDGEALDAYVSLGEELIEQVPDADAIVNFATSGTSSLGIMKAYENAGKPYPALHIAQSGKSCGVVQELHPEQIDHLDLQAGVGLSSSPRDEDLIACIAKTHGDAHYVSQEMLKKRAPGAVLASFGIQTSWEGECSFQAAQKLLNQYQKIVVILSGKHWPSAKPAHAHYAKDFEALDKAYHAASSVAQSS